MGSPRSARSLIRPGRVLMEEEQLPYRIEARAGDGVGETRPPKTGRSLGRARADSSPACISSRGGQPPGRGHRPRCLRQSGGAALGAAKSGRVQRHLGQTVLNLVRGHMHKKEGERRYLDQRAHSGRGPQEDPPDSAVRDELDQALGRLSMRQRPASCSASTRTLPSARRRSSSGMSCRDRQVTRGRRSRGTALRARELKRCLRTGFGSSSSGGPPTSACRRRSFTAR
jgi:hypothetical protein